MKLFSRLFMVSAMFAATVAFSYDAANAVTLRYAHPVTKESNTHRLGLKLKEEVEKMSNGDIKVQILPNFSNEVSLIESIQAGDIAFTLTSAAPTVSFQPKMAVFDVPFLFKSSATPEETMKNVFKVFETPEVKGTLDYLKEADIKALGYLGLGFRVMATKKDINNLADIKGLKIRTMENKNHIAAWKALKANPTPMAYSEVFTAIEQNTIDGQEQPFDILASGKYYEILDHATTIDMIFNTTVFMMSQSVFNDLSAEQQKIVEAAAAKAIAYAREDAIADVAKNMKVLTDNGMEIKGLSTEDKNVAVADTKNVEASIRKDVGDEIVDIFKKAVSNTY